jgi:hypothetical protein
VLLLLKLFLVPGLVGVVTLAVRRWGPAVGGWLAGLPLVAGPVLVFYALEQGNAFAARAAQSTLIGLLATTGFVVVYARASARLPWYGCVVVGWTAFAVVIRALYALTFGLGLGLGLVAVVAATVMGRRALPRLAPLSMYVPGPVRGDLPIRLVATATLVLVLTGLAGQLGSTLSGLLNAFPVLTTIIAAFTHAQRGRQAMVAFLNGYLQAVVGFAVFCVAMAAALPPLGLAGALLAALTAQFVSHAFLLWRGSAFRRVVAR